MFSANVTFLVNGLEAVFDALGELNRAAPHVTLWLLNPEFIPSDNGYRIQVESVPLGILPGGQVEIADYFTSQEVFDSCVEKLLAGIGLNAKIRKSLSQALGHAETAVASINGREIEVLPPPAKKAKKKARRSTLNGEVELLAYYPKAGMIKVLFEGHQVKVRLPVAIAAGIEPIHFDIFAKMQDVTRKNLAPEADEDSTYTALRSLFSALQRLLLGNE